MAVTAQPAIYTRQLLTGWLRFRYGLLLLFWTAATLWFWNWWLNPDHILPGPQYWVATAAFSWLLFMQAYFVLIFRRAVVPVAEPPDPATTRVAMIVTKTPSEPFAVVRRTLEAMLAQTYPHDTWLADEDPQPETIEWCASQGVRISTRKGQADYHRAEWPRRTRCKEGNLAFFYDHYGYDTYDFVSQLEALPIWPRSCAVLPTPVSAMSARHRSAQPMQRKAGPRGRACTPRPDFTGCFRRAMPAFLPPCASDRTMPCAPAPCAKSGGWGLNWPRIIRPRC